MINTQNNADNTDNETFITNNHKVANKRNKLNETFTMKITYSFKRHQDVSKEICMQIAESIYKTMMDDVFNTVEHNNTNEQFMVVSGQVQGSHFENVCLQ